MRPRWVCSKDDYPKSYVVGDTQTVAKLGFRCAVCQFRPSCGGPIALERLQEKK